VRRRACAASEAVDRLRHGARRVRPMSFLFIAALACVALVLAIGPALRIFVPALARRS